MARAHRLRQPRGTGRLSTLLSRLFIRLFQSTPCTRSTRSARSTRRMRCRGVAAARAALLVPLAIPAAPAQADTAKAACEIYPAGEDRASAVLPCTFSQRQGFVTIRRADGVVYDLAPAGDTYGTFTDAEGRPVYRQSELGDQGLIFRLPDESVYVYWNTAMLEPADSDNPTAPFTTAEYDATTLLRCRARDAVEFDRCPAGVLRTKSGEASVVVLSPTGEQFTINFMSDYINATNRAVAARLQGDTWILEFENGDVWEVPVAAIEGG